MALKKKQNNSLTELKQSIKEGGDMPWVFSLGLSLLGAVLSWLAAFSLRSVFKKFKNKNKQEK